MSERISKSLRNARYGIASQILYLILAFVLRIAITKHLGIVALSLNGLFSEVLSILSLAEMGVGLKRGPIPAHFLVASVRLQSPRVPLPSTLIS